MKNTTNLNLKKPESTDFYNINDFNDNFDTIDNTIFCFYDKIIKTQAEFNTLVASPTWLDSKSFLFCGEFTFDAANSGGYGVIIPQTVKLIAGTPKAKIKVLNVGTNTAFGYYDGTLGSIYTDDDTTIRDIKVEFTGTSSPDKIYGITAFKNAINCICTYTGDKTYKAVAFYNCSNLVNCRGLGSLYGFESCYRITNCVGKADGNLSDFTAGIYSSSRIVNCDSSGLNSGTGAGYAFYTTKFTNGCLAVSGEYKTAKWGGFNTKRDDNSCDIE